MRVQASHHACNPTWQPHGCTLTPTPYPCSGSPQGSPPRDPHLPSIPLTEPAHAAPSLPLAHSLGEAAPSSVHPRRPANLNPLQPHPYRHAPGFDSTPSPYPSHSRTRAGDTLNTSLAEPFFLPCPLSHRPSGRTPAHRHDRTGQHVRLATSGHPQTSKM
jgi:hypothetical protein